MKKEEITREQKLELTLLLLYLNSWQDEYKNSQAWKTHEFGLLDELKEMDYIDSANNSKSLFISPSGVEKAEALLDKYLGK